MWSALFFTRISVLFADFRHILHLFVTHSRIKQLNGVGPLSC